MKKHRNNKRSVIKLNRLTKRPRGTTLSWDKIRPWISVAVTLVAAIFLLAVVPWFFHQVVFVTNKTFVLRSFDIKGGETFTPALLEELLGRGDQPLRLGSPLFAVDIVKKQRDFLKSADQIRDITITRLLPDTLKVRIIERRPIIRVDAKDGLVADEEGVTFVRYRGTSDLPLLTGVEGYDTSIDHNLTSMALAAAHLVAFLEDQPFRIPITSIDVSHLDHLKLTLIDNKQVLLSWPQMLNPDGGSKKSLRQTLEKLAQALNTEDGRNRLFWNATVPGRIYAE